MTRPFVRKLGAPFALAYLLAGVLAAALHSHGPHGHFHAVADTESACASCHCEHSHGSTTEHADESDETPSEPDGEHHCPVCETLAKPPLPVPAVILDAAVEPSLAVAEPVAPLFTLRPALAWHSRGPPLV